MKYFEKFIDHLKSPELVNQHSLYVEAIRKYQHIGIIGNGGSNSIASHTSVDLMKFLGKRIITLSDTSMMSMLANDYGYQDSATLFLKYNMPFEGLVILISSSGESKNILNAQKWCHEHNVAYGTLSGFDKDNSLRKISNSALWNYHVDSYNYGIVECMHQIFLHGLDL